MVKRDITKGGRAEINIKGVCPPIIIMAIKHDKIKSAWDTVKNETVVALSMSSIFSAASVMAAFEVRQHRPIDAGFLGTIAVLSVDLGYRNVKAIRRKLSQTKLPSIKL